MAARVQQADGTSFFKNFKPFYVMAVPNRDQMKDLADVLKKLIGDKEVGFALFVFPFNKPGIWNYISTAQRTDMINSVRQIIDQLENKAGGLQTPSN
jgi:hypothetical protein